MKIRNQHGTSLIELMVGIVILGVVTMGLMTMISQVTTQQKVAQGRQDIMNISQEMQTMFSSPSVCKSALPTGMAFNLTQAQSSFPPAAGTALSGMPFQYKINGDTLASNATLNNYSVNASKVLLANGTLAGNDPTGNPIYRADVVGAFAPKQGSTSYAARVLTSGFFTVSGGNITDCGVQSPPTQETASATCTSLGGTYASGKCTLATSQPGPASASTNDPSLAKDPTFIATLCAEFGGTASGTTCKLSSSGGPVVVMPVGGGSGGGGRWVQTSNALTYCSGGNLVGAACSPIGATSCHPAGGLATNGYPLKCQ